jgi:hypothetical protein
MPGSPYLLSRIRPRTTLRDRLKYSRRALCVTASSVGGYRGSPAGGHEDGTALITSERTGSFLVPALRVLCPLWVTGGQVRFVASALIPWLLLRAGLLLAKLADQSAQRFGDLAGLCQRREVMANLLCHGPAKFPRLGRLVLVCLAQLQVTGGGIGPPQRRRVGSSNMASGSGGQAAAKCCRVSGPGMSSARVSSPHPRGGRRPAPGISPADWYPLFPNPVVAESCSTGSSTPATRSS